MGINTGNDIIKGINVGSNVISRAFLGSTKIYDQLDYPTLDLNFAATKTLDPRITFTRASSGSYFDSNGLIQIAAINTPRFDHNPFTGESLGLLIEEQRTNLLLNSATLSTQSVTVVNTAYTLSFYGTGSIVLSGVHSATVNGSGTFPTRTTLTFTPTAGTLTLTVSGTVQYAQLEVGNFATSWIPTTGASATRAADIAVMTGTNFSSWYRQDEGTILAEYRYLVAGITNQCPFSLDNGTSNETIVTASATPNIDRILSSSGGVYQANFGNYNFTAGQLIKRVVSIKFNDAATTANGATVSTDNSYIIPTPTQLVIGAAGYFISSRINGHIKRVAYFNRRIVNSELQILTT